MGKAPARGRRLELPLPGVGCAHIFLPLKYPRLDALCKRLGGGYNSMLMKDYEYWPYLANLTAGVSEPCWLLVLLYVLADVIDLTPDEDDEHQDCGEDSLHFSSSLLLCFFTARSIFHLKTHGKHLAQKCLNFLHLRIRAKCAERSMATSSILISK